MESQDHRPIQEITPAKQKPMRKLKIAFFALCIAFALLAVLGIVLGTSKVTMCRDMHFFTCDSRGFHLVSCGTQIVKREGSALDVNALPTPDAELFDAAMSKDTDYYETGEIREIPIWHFTLTETGPGQGDHGKKQ